MNLILSHARWAMLSLARPIISAAFFLGLATCALAASAASPSDVAAPANSPATDLQTKHYDLHIEGLDVREVGDMLEQLHGQLTTYFGQAPAGRLSVSLFATRDGWAAALQADQQFVPPRAGGYYAPYTKKVYAWTQPSAYFTRQVLLHEATHQFHWLTTTGNASPSAEWYFEGLAEYFGMHNWDGKHLQTGVIPAITLEDYPRTAKKNFEAAGSDLKKMLVRADRPEAWALVHFLVKAHADQFHKLSAMLDRREDSVGAWDQVFGSGTAELSREFGLWLGGHAQPWQVVWVAWQQRGDAIESQSQSMSMAILKDTPKTLSVKIEPQGPAGNAGLVFAYRSANDFYVFQTLAGHKLSIVRRQNDAWVAVPMDKLPPVSDFSTLSVTQDGKATTLQVGGQTIATIAATGQVGLNSEDGRTLFHVN